MISLSALADTNKKINRHAKGTSLSAPIRKIMQCIFCKKDCAGSSSVGCTAEVNEEDLMQLPLPYYPFIAHWIPGFVTLCFLTLPLIKQFVCSNPSAGETAILILLFTVLAFVIGQIIDAFRNSILEDWIFDKCCIRIDWISFATIKNDKLDNLLFVYYAFDINLILSLIPGVILIFTSYYAFLTCTVKAIAIILSVPVSFILGKDAWDIRREMAEIITKEKAS